MDNDTVKLEITSSARAEMLHILETVTEPNRIFHLYVKGFS